MWELNGEGIFNVKDARQFLDDFFLPKAPVATRWIKSIPIKVNIFAWKLHLDRLPTRVNLARRGVQVLSSSCPVCNTDQEDVPHLFFLRNVARDVSHLICRWWNVSWSPVGSYLNWLSWFNSIRLGSNVKDLLEDVFYIARWSLWSFCNQLLFSNKSPRRNVLFDDIVTRSFSWCQARSKFRFS
ncbi:RNA-directed DNA polymerase, eukaryota [Tanacetum coccineum]